VGLGLVEFITGNVESFQIDFHRLEPAVAAHLESDLLSIAFGQNICVGNIADLAPQASWASGVEQQI
jgi:DNA-directed RNA polymerase subunit F